MRKFGELLRQLRGNRTQREVAEQLSMPVTTLSTLEHQKDVPRGIILKQLCDFYGVTASYFYQEECFTPRTHSQAKAWLQLVRENAMQKEAIAFYASPDLSEELKEQLARKLRLKKHAES